LKYDDKSCIMNTEYSEKNGGSTMSSKNDFLNLLKNLKIIYDKIDEENKNRLEEAIQMVLTKFENRM